MFDPVPEVAEAAATGVVASLYQDIREVTGAKLVNLVYRHLATDAQALDWAWSALRPHFLSGQLPTQAALLRAGVNRRNQMLPVGAVTTLPASASLAVPVLATYCQTNCMNMMALTHLMGDGVAASAFTDGAVLRQTAGAAQAPGTVQSLAALAPMPPLPPLPRWDQMSAPTLATVLRLNTYAENEAPTVVASLYRHLACWPELLQPFEQMLAPLERDGLLLAARLDIASDAVRLAGSQPLSLPAAPAAFANDFGPFLSRLARVTIAKMIPVGCLLLETCEGGSKPRGR